MSVNRGGRPPVGPRVTVRLSDDQLAYVDELAHVLRESRAEAIRGIVDQYREEHPASE